MSAYERESLQLAGMADAESVHLWSAQSETLFVMLPGVGYTNQMPLMFYLHELAEQRQWDIMEVNYSFRHLPKGSTRMDNGLHASEIAGAAIAAVCEKRAYTSVVIAGKSIGTVAMTMMLESGSIQPSATLWLTPLFRELRVYASAQTQETAVAIYGDRDPSLGDLSPDELRRAGIDTIVMPGADHDMTIAGDIPASLITLGDVFRQTDAWLNRHLPSTGANV